MGRGSVRQSLAWRLDVVFYEISFSPDVSESSKKQVRRCFMKQTRAETFENVSRQGEFTVRSTSGLAWINRSHSFSSAHPNPLPEYREREPEHFQSRRFHRRRILLHRTVHTSPQD